ncbi:Ribonuclease H-like domain containing protein, partial [Parasponia andersonii]
MVFGKYSKTLLDVISDASSFLNEFQLAKCKIEYLIRSSMTNVIPWELSPPCHLKLNVDTACFFGQGFIGIGVIIRDVNSMICATMSKRINGLFEPLNADLLALREDIRFARRKGFVIKFIESNSRLAIGLVNSTGGLSSNNLIARGVKSLLRSCEGGSFHFVPRSGNEAV